MKAYKKSDEYKAIKDKKEKEEALKDFEAKLEEPYNKPIKDVHDGPMAYIVGVDDAIIMSLYANEYLQLGEGGDDEDVKLEG